MKKVKNWFWIICLWVFLPLYVKAGSIIYGDDVRLNENQYTFDLKAQDMDLNYISGQIKITNGKIINVVMANGWENKTGNSNTFSFQRTSAINGNYKIATFTVTMTNNSTYSISNLQYGKYTCTKDNYGNYYNLNSQKVSFSEYQNSCDNSKDATLKSVFPSYGSLAPSFNPHITEYTLKIDSDVEEVNFNAVPNHQKAKIVSGNICKLTNAYTNCYLVVESASGYRQTYLFKVSKLVIDHSLDGITNFTVHNGHLTEAFNDRKYTYTLIPDSATNPIYFSLKVNGTLITSKTCSSTSPLCELILTLNNQKFKYTFNIVTNSSPSVSTPQPSNPKKPSSSSSSESSSSNKNTPSKGTTPNKNNELPNAELPVETPPVETNPPMVEEPEVTLDPIEYNNQQKEEQSKAEAEQAINQEEESKKINLLLIGVIVIIVFIIMKIYHLYKRHKPLK